MNFRDWFRGRPSRGQGFPVASGSPFPGRSKPADILTDIADVRLPSAKSEPEVHPFPSSIGGTWLAEETAARGQAQKSLFAAEAETEGRGHLQKGAAATVPAGVVRGQLAEARAKTAQAHKTAVATTQVLAPHITTGPHTARLMFWAKCLLILGEMAGITSASINLGDVPALALILALAVAVSGVIGGYAGGELKKTVLAARRATAPDRLPEVLWPFAHLFLNQDAQGHTKRHNSRFLIGLAVLLLLAISVGVGTLRTAVQGSAAGQTFFLFAFAVAAASWWVSYLATDDIADLIRSAEKAANDAARAERRLASDPVIATVAVSEVTTGSLGREMDSRGQAAVSSLMAAQYRAYTFNPGVVGAGPAADTPTTPAEDRSVGSRPRAAFTPPGTMPLFLPPQPDDALAFADESQAHRNGVMGR